MMRDRNFYSILGVASDATVDEINAAFRRASLQYHPDKIKASGLEPAIAHRFMLDLLTIVGVLRDVDRRAAYDRWCEWVREQEATGGLSFTPDGYKIEIYKGRR